MVSKTACTLTIALLSLFLFSGNSMAQRGGRGGGGFRGAEAQAPDGIDQENLGRGRGGGRGAAGVQAGGARGNTAGKLFAAIDANQDGIITREEMQNAMRAFAKLDEDNDGKLTAEEAGERAAGGRGAAMRGRGGQGQGTQGGARRGGGGQRGRGTAAPREQDSSGKSGKGNPLLND
jgi:hypothetical protein